MYHFVEPWRASFQEIAEFLTGQQADVADDRVLATVLFTDIVDSTRRAAEIGDRDWQRLLDAHDAVVRAQLARFRGREVNTSGDGFLAMFDGPQRAIRCAMAIRDAVQALGIEVRAGLHTGECEVRGDDIGGIAVHIGARVSALAGPNDVLVSSTLRDLVIGSGLEFEDRGAHELKGVPGEWHLFAVASVAGGGRQNGGGLLRSPHAASLSRRSAAPAMRCCGAGVSAFGHHRDAVCRWAVGGWRTGPTAGGFAQLGKRCSAPGWVVCVCPFGAEVQMTVPSGICSSSQPCRPRQKVLSKWCFRQRHFRFDAHVGPTG